jgi:hypothetical protein
MRAVAVAASAVHRDQKICHCRKFASRSARCRPKLPAVPNSARCQEPNFTRMKIFSGESFCKPFNAFFQGECPKFRPILWITYKEAFETH